VSTSRHGSGHRRGILSWDFALRKHLQDSARSQGAEDQCQRIKLLAHKSWDMARRLRLICGYGLYSLGSAQRKVVVQSKESKEGGTAVVFSCATAPYSQQAQVNRVATSSGVLRSWAAHKGTGLHPPDACGGCLRCRGGSEGLRSGLFAPRNWAKGLRCSDHCRPAFPVYSCRFCPALMSRLTGIAIVHPLLRKSNYTE
jgi:hypothetical protein